MNKYIKLIYIYKALLGYISLVAIYPFWLSSWIHKVRGVKMNNFKRVYIAPGVLIDSIYPEYLEVEDDVYLTRGVKILTHINYTPSIQKIMGKENKVQKVLIKEGSFIGIDSIILPGVIIGKCCIIGAGSIVTKDIPDYSIAVGNPAKVVRSIKDD